MNTSCCQPCPACVCVMLRIMLHMRISRRVSLYARGKVKTCHTHERFMLSVVSHACMRHATNHVTREYESCHESLHTRRGEVMLHTWMRYAISHFTQSKCFMLRVTTHMWMSRVSSHVARTHESCRTYESDNHLTYLRVTWQLHLWTSQLYTQDKANSCHARVWVVLPVKFHGKNSYATIISNLDYQILTNLSFQFCCILRAVLFQWKMWYCI